jgi:hypothetical protein
MQEWAGEDPTGAVARGLQRLPGHIHLQDQPNPPRLRRSHFHNLLHSRKAVPGEV